MSQFQLTPEIIENLIRSEQYHVFEGTRTTVCCLILRNGFAVTGESASIAAKNFDAEKGRQVARQNAVRKIWEIEGYLLRQQLYLAEGAKA